MCHTCISKSCRVLSRNDLEMALKLHLLTSNDLQYYLECYNWVLCPQNRYETCATLIFCNVLKSQKLKQWEFGGHLGFGDLEKRGSMDFFKFCSTSLAGVPRIPKIPTRPRSRNFLLNLISNPVWSGMTLKIHNLDLHDLDPLPP